MHCILWLMTAVPFGRRVLVTVQSFSSCWIDGSFYLGPLILVLIVALFLETCCALFVAQVVSAK